MNPLGSAGGSGAHKEKEIQREGRVKGKTQFQEQQLLHNAGSSSSGKGQGEKKKKPTASPVSCLSTYDSQRVLFFSLQEFFLSKVKIRILDAH
jgi:hypothetical protein